MYASKECKFRQKLGFMMQSIDIWDRILLQPEKNIFGKSGHPELFFASIYLLCGKPQHFSIKQHRFYFRILIHLGAKISQLMTKPTKWHVRPAKTQISLGIRPVWSVFAVRPRLLHAEAKPLIRLCGCPDLSLRWAHMPLCWFCHEAAHK